MTGRVRTAILISGRGSNMKALIEAARLRDFSAEIALVVSDNPDAAGLKIARQAGVAAKAIDFKRFLARREFEAELHANLVSAEIELICLAGFMRILSPEFIERWTGRILNIHPSLLPELRGLHTHERALAEARREHGCTVHYVTAELDAGPIIAQARVPILGDDDVDSLAARVLVEEHRIYPLALDAVARGFRAT